jgi:NAD(P)-dependent dehydrogenase (short-subunit alcohol dehydrogenase family)
MSKEKVALITGVSSGIGQGVARQLGQKGFAVFGTSRNPRGVEPMPGVEVLPLDVCLDESVKAFLEAVLAQVERLDVLVNNAGYVLGGAIEEVSIEEAKAQFETNFFGAMRMVKAVLPMMRQQRSGQIINISSLAGLISAPPFWGIYSASKYALEAYTEHLWREVKPFNVRVSLVEPGSIKTHLTRNQQNAAEPISDYEPWRERAFEASRQYEEKAPDPALVADCVVRIIESKSPKLRNRVGKQATWVPRLRKISSEARFEKVIRNVFHLDVEK